MSDATQGPGELTEHQVGYDGPLQIQDEEVECDDVVDERGGDGGEDLAAVERVGQLDRFEQFRVAVYQHLQLVDRRRSF